MDPRRPPRLKALLQILVLLKSSGTVKQQRETITGMDPHVQCVNDYLYTMNCSLNLTPSGNTSISNKSYRLKVRETTDGLEYECLLTNTTGGYFCSINKLEETSDVDIFTDLDEYEISLCQSRDGGSESCEVLDEDYNPSLNIKPNAPSLAVGHNSSRVHFTWRSTYEEYSSSTDLVSCLQYQLLLYRTDDKNTEEMHVDTENTHCTLETSTLVEKFESDTEYAARVRSSPGTHHYKGQWSDWSSEVLWRTDPAGNDDLPTKTIIFELPVVFGALCAVVIIVLVLYYGPIKMWRQSTFIPTPALYFHSLYKDYQGDFKSWVVAQETPLGALKAEETLKIDTLVHCVDAQGDRSLPVFQQQWAEGSGYRNMPATDRDVDLSTLCTGSSWLSAQWSSGNSLPAWSESGSPAGDSGCWLCSDAALEGEPPWYRNEYCTLTRVQGSGCVSAEHHGNPAQHKSSA